MAVVRLNSGADQTVSAERCLELWDVLTGRTDPDEKMEEYASHVKNVYLDWRTAPDEYIEQRKAIIFPMAIATWMVDRTGTPTRPEPSDNFGRQFGKRWGLLKNGYISPLGWRYTETPSTASRQVELIEDPFDD